MDHKKDKRAAREEVTETVPVEGAAPAKKTRQRAPENETARERFKRVAGGRLTGAIDAMRLLGQVGLSNEYEFSRDDAEKIIAKIAEATLDMTEKLRERKTAKAGVESLFD